MFCITSVLYYLCRRFRCNRFVFTGRLVKGNPVRIRNCTRSCKFFRPRHFLTATDFRLKLGRQPVKRGG